MEPDEWRDRVGRFVERRRLDVGLRSMRAAAARGGISESVWRQIEKGRRILHPKLVVAPTPTATTKHAVAKALGWPPEAIDLLLTGRDPSAPDFPAEPPEGHSAWNQEPDGSTGAEERVAASLADVVSFLTAEEREQLTDIAQTFLKRRRAAEAADGS